MNKITLGVVISVAFGVAACDVNQEMPLTVVVYPIVKKCAIKQQEKEQEVECAKLGTYLHETLKVSANRQINVSLTGTDPVSKDDKSIDNVAELIRTAGYKDVRTWRFGM
jgi:hypothetical protein